MKQLSNYQHIMSSLKEKIRQARFKAALTVNTQLLSIFQFVQPPAAQIKTGKKSDLSILQPLVAQLPKTKKATRIKSQLRKMYLRNYQSQYIDLYKKRNPEV